jgi:hypothetical protein
MQFENEPHSIYYIYVVVKFSYVQHVALIHRIELMWDVNK